MRKIRKINKKKIKDKLKLILIDWLMNLEDGKKVTGIELWEKWKKLDQTLENLLNHLLKSK